MIIKGNRHSNGAKLAAYLMDGGKHGERVAEPELHGFAAEDLSGALRDAQNLGDGLGIEYPLFHIQIRLPQQDHMTREQWDETTARTLKTAGLEGQAYARVFHTDEKTGELHCHLAVSLIDEQTHHAKALPFYKLRFKALARKLEEEFDLTRVKNYRDGPIKYAATKAEEQQAQRLGFDKEAVRNTIRHCWDSADCGKSFEAALADTGLILAQSDRGHGNYLVIDPKGGLHVLGKRILDASAAQVRDRLADLDRDKLPTVENARALLLDLPRDRVEKLTRELAEVQKQIEAEQEYARRDPVRDEIQWQEALEKAAIAKEKKERQFVDPQQRAKEETRAGREQTAPAGREERHWPVNPPQHQSWPGFEKAATEATRDNRTENLRGPAAKAWDAFAHSDSAKAYAAALDDKGIMFAAVTKEEANRSERQAAFAKAVGNRAQRFKEGEIVLVTEPPLEYRRADQVFTPSRVHKLDPSLAYKLTKGLDTELRGIDATLKASGQRAQQRAADREAIRDVYADSREHRRRTIAAERSIRNGAAATRDAIHTSAAVLGKAASVASSVGKALDVIGGMVESLAAPTLTPEQKHDAAKAKDRREAHTEDAIEFSRYDAARAHERQNHQEQQAARDRQREHERER